jgi:23S rRNA (adenine2503-C2)-methyltransferase
MARDNDLKTKLDPDDGSSVSQLVEELYSQGFESLVSIGEQEENKIGSNCGQYVTRIPLVV